MATSGAQLGNTNASKTKLWGETIKRALLAEDGKKLRQLADKLIECAMQGDTSALKEIGDRVDGKPNQSISGPEGESLLGPLVTAADAIRQAIRG